MSGSCGILLGDDGVLGRAQARWDENMMESRGHLPLILSCLLLSFLIFLISVWPLGSELLLRPETILYFNFRQEESTSRNHSFNSDTLPYPQTNEIRFLKWVTEKKNRQRPFLSINPPLWIILFVCGALHRLLFISFKDVFSVFLMTAEFLRLLTSLGYSVSLCFVSPEENILQNGETHQPWLWSKLLKQGRSYSLETWVGGVGNRIQ